MERCVEEIRTWMLTDKLSLNDNNTEFLIIGTKQQLSKISPYHLTIGGILEGEWIRALPSKITLTKRLELLTFRYTISGTSESF